jgi:chromosome segregation ATPase
MNSTLLDVAQVVAVLFGAGGVWTFLRANAERKKIGAEAKRLDVDAAKLLSDSAIALLHPMQQRIGHLTTELERATTELIRAHGRIAALTADVETAQRRITELRTQLTQGNVDD